MNFNIKSVVENFKICGTILNSVSYGSGHINDTYLITTAENYCPDYILQRINHLIFNNVPALMNNVERVTRHIKKKLLQQGNSIPDREVLTLIPTHEDKAYYSDPEGNYWRVYIFINESYCYELVKTPQLAYQGGKIFGKFLAMLADLPEPPLTETIYDFHNIEKRLQAFFKLVDDDPGMRVGDIKNEMRFVEKRAEEIIKIYHQATDYKIPIRITHNDTKFNNILFDVNQNALCIIDLDTVMPGFIHFDFGDAVRTCTNTATEDEQDLAKVAMNLELLRAYTKGFMEEAKVFLTDGEVINLVPAIKLFPYLMGLRFLTDYIDGDKYFRITFSYHNLQRARNQFKLLTSIEEQYDDILAFIDRFQVRK